MQALFLASKLLVLSCLLLAILFVDRSHHSPSVDGNQMARVKYLRGLISQAQSELAQLSVLERNVPEPERSVLRRAPSFLNPLRPRMPPTSDKLRQWFTSIAADIGKQIESRTSKSYEEPHTNKYKDICLPSMMSIIDPMGPSTEVHDEAAANEFLNKYLTTVAGRMESIIFYHFQRRSTLD